MSIATLLSQHHQVTAVDIIPEKVDMINNRKDFFVASVIDVLRGEGSFSLLWFLFSLFFVEIIYYVIYRLIKNKRSICIIAFILALIAHYSRTEGVPNYFFWSSTIEAMLFFSLGNKGKIMNLIMLLKRK